MIAKISTGSYVEGMVKYNHEKIKEVPEGEEKGLLLSVNNIKSNDFKDIVDANTRQYIDPLVMKNIV